DEVKRIKETFDQLLLKMPGILVINKKDLISKTKLEKIKAAFPEEKWMAKVAVSALQKQGLDKLLKEITKNLPENPPFYPEDTLTDRPVKFFVSELIREKLYTLFRDEIPYQTTAII